MIGRRRANGEAGSWPALGHGNLEPDFTRKMTLEFVPFWVTRASK